MKHLYSFLYCCLLSSALAAQEKSDLLNVFLAPENFEFFRSEVNFVNFVSDRQLSDIQFQSVAEPIGNGSTRFRYFFAGYGKFSGQNDTIIWHADPAENEGSIREKSLMAFRQGLLKYILQTPLANAISYEVSPIYDHYSTNDRWDRWTFKPGLNLYGNGAYNKESNPLGDTLETQNGTFSLRPSFSYWYISNQWRISGGVDYTYFNSWKNAVSDVDDYNQKQSYLNVRINGVYTLAPRWSVGAGLSRSHRWESSQPSLFVNGTTDRLKIGVEHSFIPYEDYYRKRFVVGYTWGLTIADGSSVKLPDILYRNHQLYGAYTKIDRWGYFVADLSATLDHIPDQWTRYALVSNVRFAFNLGKNIYTTLSFDGDWSKTALDLNVFGGPPTSQSRKSDYAQYSYSLGIDYYFGSSYRNVVNPRLYASDQFF